MSAANPPPATPTAEAAAAADYDQLDDLDLPPLRIRATQMRDRLSASSLNIPPGLQSQISQKRYSLDSKASLLATASPTGVGSLASTSRRGRSRSRSPSLRAKERFADGNSSLSSLEDFVDSDILYDKLGFVEFDSKKQGHASFTYGDNNNTNTTGLTPVSERMSEDTLEDVHAFSDLSANTNTRPSSSVGTGGSTVGGEDFSQMLEPLDEGDEDDLESEDDENLTDNERQPSQIILTNLENIVENIALQDGEQPQHDNNKEEEKA